MTTNKKHRRITWRVRQCADGFLPVVLIGEEPIVMGAQPNKHMARKLARAYASKMRDANTSF